VGAIKDGPMLPAGFTATNPVPAWGGAEAEDVDAGERQIRRFLQHRDRLVTATDFQTIAWRSPGVSVGRVEVLPAWHPSLAPAAPGAAPGVVTLMVVPRSDPEKPDAPRPNRAFLDAMCAQLEPRRLVTTELVLRGPVYKGIWISVGIEPGPRESVAATAELVRQRLRTLLSPLPPSGFSGQSSPLYGALPPPELRGWPLNQSVQAKVLLAEVARVPGVRSVAGLRLAEGLGPETDAVSILGIELPEILGISVVAGEPLDLSSLRGDGGAAGGTGSGSGTGSAGKRRLPVPVVAENC
jgi:predicted phage baseplate assembly protein